MIKWSKISLNSSVISQYYYTTSCLPIKNGGDAWLFPTLIFCKLQPQRGLILPQGLHSLNGTYRGREGQEEAGGKREQGVKGMGPGGKGKRAKGQGKQAKERKGKGLKHMQLRWMHAAREVPPLTDAFLTFHLS